MIEQKVLTRGRAAIVYDGRQGRKISAEMFAPQYWREHDAVVGEASGRGVTLYVDAGGEQWVLRPYRRGGMFARLVERTYLFTGQSRTRCFREFAVLARLHELSMPVPQPVGAWFERSGLVYRAALLTLRIADSETLARRLRSGPLAPETWLAVGRCLRGFHDIGLCHADLNAHNILIDGSGRIYVIDMDRARFREPGGAWSRSNLARLRRSLNKVSVEEGAEFRGDRDWAALKAGYAHSPARAS
ncbi:MAG: 3-deoxy-D-manno-octulosonic acid kinase [Gammaproteobacteria bacterium]|nr:3-deoxy-D-manno-octulosonic acid kinase [Gammaproteobacteria bacterium]